jgi:hypothetical protein
VSLADPTSARTPVAPPDETCPPVGDRPTGSDEVQELRRTGEEGGRLFAGNDTVPRLPSRAGIPPGAVRWARFHAARSVDLSGRGQTLFTDCSK